MDFHLPELGEGVLEAELVAWLVRPGDAVKRGENLMEVVTDKATMEVPSPFVGTITELTAQPGDRVKVGSTVLTYEGAEAVAENGAQRTPAERAGVSRTAAAEPRAARAEARPRVPPAGVKAAPSVRYLARKLGVDLARVHGSGPGGRILVDDLSTLLNHRLPQSRDAAEPGPDCGKPGTRVPLRGVRRTIAEHMVRSVQTIPHYAYVDECDVTELVRLRDGLRDTFTAAGTKLTYLAFFVKAAVEALKEIPIVNASLDEKTQEIVLHDHYHVGIAVATPQGLIVPVIHDADQKDLLGLAREIERLSADARVKKSRLEDLRGGTFTITSIGGVGGLISTPIINHPEVAILGVGKVVKRPAFDAAGSVRAADMVYLSFSFDHRIIDGAVGAAFGNALSRRLQNPAPLLLK